MDTNGVALVTFSRITFMSTIILYHFYKGRKVFPVLLFACKVELPAINTIFLV